MRVDAEAVHGEGPAPEIRVRIETSAARELELAADGPLTIALTVTEAIAARDALNRALNDLGLPDQD